MDPIVIDDENEGNEIENENEEPTQTILFGDCAEHKDINVLKKCIYMGVCAGDNITSGVGGGPEFGNVIIGDGYAGVNSKINFYVEPVQSITQNFNYAEAFLREYNGMVEIVYGHLHLTDKQRKKIFDVFAIMESQCVDTTIARFHAELDRRGHS